MSRLHDGWGSPRPPEPAWRASRLRGGLAPDLALIAVLTLLAGGAPLVVMWLVIQL